MASNEPLAPAPLCIVTPVPVLGGERRTYRGIAQPFAAHAHCHYVIGLVREGKRELELNGKLVLIGPGDLIVFNPDDVHGCHSVSTELFAYDSVTVAATVLDGAHLHFPKAADCEATHAFEDLLSAIENESEQDVLEQALHLASCLDVEERPGQPSATQEKSGRLQGIHEEAAVRTFAHLRGHLAEPHSVSDLAAREDLSPYTLIRAYRRRFAITPLQHLMSLRVECACKLLSAGATPAAVAAETGFADQAHLTRVFKQRMGTTPAAYRRMTSDAKLWHQTGISYLSANRR